ncbi:MAG: S9 family peptidase [candidate division Zixibacteria bacterium]|nr:S9 family peptidase [candidate division Zixibacteria bacterium]
MKKSLILLVLVLAASTQADQKRQIIFNDLYSFPQIKNLSLSPDNRNLICESKIYNLEDDSYATNLWLVPLNGIPAYQFTNGNHDSSPRWSPDSKTIAFISARGGDSAEVNISQIWLMPAGGGEARQLTNISTEADDPVWSKDGRMILFESSVYPDCENDNCNRQRDEDKAASKIKAKLYDDLLFRHYKYWEDGKRNHIFKVDVQTGEYQNLTPFDKDAPPIALAGDHRYCFSPDGSEVTFVMNTDTVIAVSTNNDIFTLSIKNRQLTRISTSPGNDTDPCYSPSGRYLAYRSMARAGFEADQKDLIIYDRTRKTFTNKTESFDRSIGEFIWGPYSKYIYFTAVDKGWIKIHRLTIKSGEIKALVDDGVCSDIQISSNGNHLYYLKATATRHYEIFEYNNKNGSETRLTHYTDSLFSRLNLSEPEYFRFEGARGDSVHGILTLPPDFTPTRQYPLTLLIHGGPQWCWLRNFNYYGWNTQILADQGYVVAQIDPHGSRGYGQDFVDAVTDDWGGAPYEDLLLGIDYLIAEHEYIDTTKLAALGRSYGGYMINWINGQTDRFACLVSVSGDFDNISAYYSTEELWFPNWEFGGWPWENKEGYLKHSPAEYVHNFKTPTLVIHGQLDYRVDVSQGLMMFTALRARDIPAQLLYFPDEGHSLMKLHNIRYQYEVQLDWLAEYLK